MGFAGFRMRCGGRCCKNACIIHYDDFEDATLSGMTTTGDVTESGGNLIMTGASTVIFDSASDAASTPVRLFVRPKILSGSATYRLRVNLGSGNDTYFFGNVAVTGGVGTMSNGRTVAGVDSTYESDALDDEGAELEERAMACLSWTPRGEFEPGDDGILGAIFPDRVTDLGTGWTDLDNVLADDGATAAFNFPSSGGTEDTSIIALHWDGINIPSGSTIDGVEVEIQATGGGGLFDVIDLLVTFFNGEVSFENKSTGVAFGTDEIRGYGGSTDDWGGLTWEDVNNPSFAFHLQFRRNTAFTGGGVTVDYAGKLVIHYTTPSGRKGTLVFSYVNTADAQRAQCVKEFTAFSPSDANLKAGLEVISGTVDFSEASYEFLESDDHPGCETCGCEVVASSDCRLCEDETTPARILVTVEGITSLVPASCINFDHTRAVTGGNVEDAGSFCAGGTNDSYVFCLWLSGGSQFCEFPDVAIRVMVAQHLVDNTYWIVATMRTAFAGVDVHWALQLGGRPNCIADIDGLELPNCRSSIFGIGCGDPPYIGCGYDATNSIVRLEVVA